MSFKFIPILSLVVLAGACGSSSQTVGDQTLDEGAEVAAVVETITTTSLPMAETSTTRLALPAPANSDELSDGAGSADDGGSDPASPPDSTATTSDAPTTQPPTTQAPTTQAPTTQAPTTQAPTTTQPPTTSAPSANNFPGIALVEVSGRQNVDMAQRLGNGDRPVLLWFWTPF